MNNTFTENKMKVSFDILKFFPILMYGIANGGISTRM